MTLTNEVPMVDETDNLLLGAGVGFGSLAWKIYEKRNAFKEQLEEGLATVGVRLVYPDLGYLPDGRHVWHLTIEGPRGAVTLFSPLTPGADPYAPATVSDLVRRVGNWLTRAA